MAPLTRMLHDSMMGDPWEADAPRAPSTTPDGGLEDVLEVGHDAPGWLRALGRRARRVPPIVRLAVAVVASAAVAAVLIVQAHGGSRPAAGPGSSSAGPVLDPGGRRDDAFADVRALAAAGTRDADIVRSATTGAPCPTVEVGRQPSHVAVRAVQRTLPSFTPAGVTRVLDQATGLCALDVRLRGPGRALLVVRVTPPARPARHAAGHTSAGSQRAATSDRGLVETSYVLVTTRTGWTVLVGATGPASGAPGRSELRSIAARRALRW